jgi:PAS domain S-box-containing protein
MAESSQPRENGSNVDSAQAVYARYRDLQRYVGWTEADAQRVMAAMPHVMPHFASLVDDFYAEIERHPVARQAITGGAEQILRLKQTLNRWLAELFTGLYDEQYVERRWRVGLRHVEIGLPQVYTAAALSRLRNGITRALRQEWGADEQALSNCLQSLNKLLDLDLAMIGDSYETEFVRRQQEAERRRLQDVLHQEKELSAGLLAHAQAAVLILDRRGRIVRFNPYLHRLVLSTLGPLEDLDWFERFAPAEDRERLREVLLKPGNSPGRQPITASSQIIAEDGRPRFLHWSGMPLRDAAGLPFAVLLIGHDITDLQEAQSQALQAQRLAAIGEMATGLAHESRNALQRIAASAEVLEDELEGNAAALAHINRIQQAQRHIHRLLDEVRTYAAPVVLDRSECRISEFWREAWALLQPQRGQRDVELREELQTQSLTVEADRFRMVQVFRNILDNALAACSDPVRLVVACCRTELSGTAAIRVAVRDNGPGLDAQQRNRIFQPFFTTKPTGTGLGMAIVQRIVEAHGGRVAVGDSSQQGAEIVLTLPAKSSRPGLHAVFGGE